MTIRFLCPLGHPLAVPDNRAGKKGRCPVCRQRVYIPKLADAPSLSDDDVAEMLADVSDDEDVEDDAEANIEPDALPPEAAPAPPPRKPQRASPARAKGQGSASSAKSSEREHKPAGGSPKASASPEGSLASDAPGDLHQRLEGLIGQWNCRIKLWLEPGGSPELSAGSADTQWAMGQRFVQVVSDGTLLDEAFNSLLILGYDNARQVYTSCYLDNRSTGVFHAEGQADAGGQALRLFGSMHGWQPGEHNRAYLYVIGLHHHAKWTLELHDVLRGEKVMEIVYSRKW